MFLGSLLRYPGKSLGCLNREPFYRIPSGKVSVDFLEEATQQLVSPLLMAPAYSGPRSLIEGRWIQEMTNNWSVM